MKICILIFILLSTASYSQVTRQWSTSSANYNFINPRGIVVDNFGYIYSTGPSNNTSSCDFVTVKINSSGVKQWEKIYSQNSTSRDNPYGIALDDSGNVYVTGESSIPLNSKYSTVTIKYDSLGVVKWMSKYDGPMFNSVCTDIEMDHSGNIFVCGTSVSDTSHTDYLILKYNTSGTLLWEARYNNNDSANYNVPTKMVLDNVGNVYVTGYSTKYPFTTQCATVKFNSSGVLQWSARFGNNNNGPVSSINVDNERNVYISGFYSVKYNSSGVQQWAVKFVNEGSAASSSIIDSSGNLYAIGSVNGDIFPYNNSDYLTRKYNSLGDSVWSARYFNTAFRQDDYGKSIAKDKFGNIYVTGTSRNNEPGDFLTLKYSIDGVELWQQRYPAQLNDGWEDAISVVVDNFNNVYVLGITGYDLKFLLVKYSQSVGINNISNTVPGNFSLYQNYPNPFNPTTKIKFDIPKSSDVKLIIFDAVGREVRNITQTNLTAGSYEYEFNGESLSSGIYYFKLQTNEFSKTMKMVLVK